MTKPCRLQTSKFERPVRRILTSTNWRLSSPTVPLLWALAPSVLATVAQDALLWRPVSTRDLSLSLVMELPARCFVLAEDVVPSGPATHFLSWAWSYHLQTVVLALRHWCEDACILRDLRARSDSDSSIALLEGHWQ